MEENNNQQLDNKNNTNISNHSQEQAFGNISSNNDSDQFHKFDHTSFNYTKLEEEYGEIKKKFYSSK